MTKVLTLSSQISLLGSEEVADRIFCFNREYNPKAKWGSIKQEFDFAKIKLAMRTELRVSKLVNRRSLLGNVQTFEGLSVLRDIDVDQNSSNWT
jgi:hypothetical protein